MPDTDNSYNVPERKLCLPRRARLPTFSKKLVNTFSNITAILAGLPFNINIVQVLEPHSNKRHYLFLASCTYCISASKKLNNVNK